MYSKSFLILFLLFPIFGYSETMIINIESKYDDGYAMLGIYNKKDNFGIIHNFHNFGAGLICEAKVNEKIYYLPFSRKFLLEINNSSKTIILDLSKELIND